MNLTIIGVGYVGLVAGACLARMGHAVMCVDRDQRKIEDLQRGHLPIYEKGLQELVQAGTMGGNLHFTSRIEEGILFADMLFITVDTPTNASGEADLSQVLEVVRSITSIGKGHKRVVIKSTVPVGTCNHLQETYSIEKSLEGTIEFVSNPEFLRQGNAIGDFLHPDRIVIGTQTKKTADLLHKIYETIDAPILMVKPSTAEMIKYASNAFLATKISFINMMANLCEQTGVDVNELQEGMGLDHRIGKHFLQSGIGFGGSCLPKDLSALLSLGQTYSTPLPILDAVLAINEDRSIQFVTRLKGLLNGDIEGKELVCWGITFKADTDDVRNSPALQVIKELLQEGARVTVYDPMMHRVNSVHLEEVSIVQDIYQSVRGKDALLVLNDGPAFREVEWSWIYEQMATPIILDGRNGLNGLPLSSLGFKYYSVGVAPLF
jgi:UDPglucose 6-dehydrogenase